MRKYANFESVVSVSVRFPAKGSGKPADGSLNLRKPCAQGKRRISHEGDEPWARAKSNAPDERRNVLRGWSFFIAVSPYFLCVDFTEFLLGFVLPASTQV